ncbi:MAG: DUF1549 domain-containing protein, partial [Proteobacteria bacterium]|nr:DUF1549 domain-containing protein [Pseudomonadota bacterium]
MRIESDLLKSGPFSHLPISPSPRFGAVQFALADDSRNAERTDARPPRLTSGLARNAIPLHAWESPLNTLGSIFHLTLLCLVAGGTAVFAAAPTLEAGRQHWAFQPLGKAPQPAVRDAAWARNEVDRFILAALEAKGLRPSPEAGRPTLIRRVTLDLIGLPPSPE